MCDEPYMIIGLGNAYDFVIKNVNEPETYGTFQGDRKSIKKFVEKVNSIVKENEQLKQRCKELRNDLIDHSALINMLEKVKALNIEDIIWNTMGYKTQTEFDDDFADYREYAKKRWKE